MTIPPREPSAPAQMSQTTKALMGLRELILNGALHPGETLQEIPVAERLGVSRTPVRAALARLEEEGLLERTAGTYAVRAFSPTDVQDAIELRGALEGTAARLAAERGVSRLALAPLRDTVSHIDSLLTGAQLRLNSTDIDRYMELNASFHRGLAGLTGSFVMTRTVDHVMLLPFASPNAMVFHFTEAADVWKTFFIAQEHHRGLLDAIEHREGTRAESLAREHARLSLRALRTALDRRDGDLAAVPGLNLLVTP